MKQNTKKQKLKAIVLKEIKKLENKFGLFIPLEEFKTSLKNKLNEKEFENIIQNKDHFFRELSKPNEELYLIEKLFSVYEQIIESEKKFGKIVSRKQLEKVILKRNKKSYYKVKITKTGLNNLLEKLLASGVIFYPKGGYVQRTITFNWKDVKK